MATLSPQTPREDLLDLLAYVSGHLKTASAHDKRAVERLQEQLVHTLGHDDLATIRSHFLSIDASDLFASAATASPQRTRLAQLIDRIGPTRSDAPEMRVFVRNVPVRSALI